MLIVIGLLVLALAAALWAPNTPIGKVLRATLIEAPVKALRRATPLQVVVSLIVFISIAAFIVGAPEWIALFGLGDLASYLDVGLILLLTSAAGHLKPLLARAAGWARGTAASVVRWTRVYVRNRLFRPRKAIAAVQEDDQDSECDLAFA